MECPDISRCFFRIYMIFRFAIICLVSGSVSLQGAATDTLLFQEFMQPLRVLYQSNQWEAALREGESTLLKIQKYLAYPIHYESQLHGLLGDCELELGRFDLARMHYETALQQLESGDDAVSNYRADMLHKLGNYYLEVKDFTAAVPFIERALKLRQRLYGPDHLLVADVLNNLGISFLSLGDFARALDFQREALRIRQLHLTFPDRTLAQTYNNIGQCYQDAYNLEEALDAYLLALANYPDQKEQPGKADVLLNLGTVYFEQSDPDQSIGYYLKALDLYISESPRSEVGIALCYNNLGNAWLEKNRPDLAGEFYHKALQLRQGLHGEVHPDVAETWFNIAQSDRFSEEPATAVINFHQCMKALRFDPADEKRLEKVNSYQILIYALYYLADVYRQQYLLKQDAEYLILALKQFEYADEVLDYLRIRYEAVGSKLNLVYLGHIVYEAAMVIAMELQAETREARYWHFAFQFAEKSKGLLLLDALQKSKADAFSGVPSEVLQEISGLENMIGELEKKRFLYENKGSTDGPLDSLDNRIFETRLLLSEKIRLISQTYPEYYNLRYGTAIPSVPKIQQELIGPDQTLIEYFLGSDLQIFVINQDQFEVITVQLPQDFYIQLDTFSASIRQFSSVSTSALPGNISSYTHAATQLYRYLVAPARDLLRKKLIIVPDDRLGYVSFDALLTRKVDSLSYFRNHPYLIRDHSISYNYSASLLAEMKTPKWTKGGSGYLGFAPDFSEDQIDGLADLLFNLDEIQEAKKQWGGRIFAGDQATKSNFIAEQLKYGVIHLATHGKVNNESEDFSFLAFAKNQSDNPDDYFLYLREVYNLPVRAQMVILSACETATGKLWEGEGIASIARGFSYAGAESLIATRWNINDKTTSQLMGIFLQNIRKGMLKDDALQEAMIRYINSQNHPNAHPFYWASFMAIGNMIPVNPSPATIPWMLIISGFFIILFPILYYWRKNKSTKIRIDPKI